MWAKQEAAKRNNKKALRELSEIGVPPFIKSAEQWGVLRKWTARFNSMIYSDDEIKHPGLLKSTKALFQSKDYSLIDVYRSFVKGFKLVYHLDFIKDIAKVDFKEQMPKVSIPVTFIHGSKDLHVYGQLVEDYINILDADKGKQLIWLEKSSHVFHPHDTKLIEQHIIEELKHSTNFGA